jgi:hypothetical protein
VASVTCKMTKTGAPVYCVCWVNVGGRQVDLTNSVKKPVPLDSGEYHLLWEVKGKIGEGVAIEVSVNGKVAATLAAQLIAAGNRAGSGSRPESPSYKPLPFKV